MIWLTGWALHSGLAGAIAAAHVLRGWLYRITPLDDLTMASVRRARSRCGRRGWPAWRSARIDPTTALRRHLVRIPWIVPARTVCRDEPQEP